MDPTDWFSRELGGIDFTGIEGPDKPGYDKAAEKAAFEEMMQRGTAEGWALPIGEGAFAIDQRAVEDGRAAEFWEGVAGNESIVDFSNAMPNKATNTVSAVKLLVAGGGWSGWDDRDYKNAGPMLTRLMATEDRHDKAKAAWMQVTMQRMAAGLGAPSGMTSTETESGGAMLMAFTMAAQLSRTLWQLTFTTESLTGLVAFLEAEIAEQKIPDMPCGCVMADDLDWLRNALSHCGDEEREYGDFRMYVQCSYTAMLIAHAPVPGIKVRALANGLGMPTLDSMLEAAGAFDAYKAEQAKLGGDHGDA